MRTKYTVVQAAPAESGARVESGKATRLRCTCGAVVFLPCDRADATEGVKNQDLFASVVGAETAQRADAATLVLVSWHGPQRLMLRTARATANTTPRVTTRGTPAYEAGGARLRGGRRSLRRVR